MLEEILRSCANPNIAAAAVVSIGGPFASRVSLLAGAAGMRPGDFVAREVMRFSEAGNEAIQGEMAEALRGSDQPILLGLQLIVAHGSGQDPFAKSRARAGPLRRDATGGCEACVA